MSRSAYPEAELLLELELDDELLELDEELLELKLELLDLEDGLLELDGLLGLDGELEPIGICNSGTSGWLGLSLRSPSGTANPWSTSLGLRRLSPSHPPSPGVPAQPDKFSL